MQLVTIVDVRKAGYCVLGTRRHCDTLGLDFKKLCREGLPLADVEGIDDAGVQRICNAARERIANE